MCQHFPRIIKTALYKQAFIMANRTLTLGYRLRFLGKPSGFPPCPFLLGENSCFPPMPPLALLDAEYNALHLQRFLEIYYAPLRRVRAES